jgi:hypothetical protein
MCVSAIICSLAQRAQRLRQSLLPVGIGARRPHHPCKERLSLAKVRAAAMGESAARLLSGRAGKLDRATLGRSRRDATAEERVTMERARNHYAKRSWPRVMAADWVMTPIAAVGVPIVLTIILAGIPVWRGWLRMTGAWHSSPVSGCWAVMPCCARRVRRWPRAISILRRHS